MGEGDMFDSLCRESGIGETQVVSVRCLMSLSSHLLRPRRAPFS